ncbi:MAG: AAA family ATPase [Thermoleophilia bacterium]|nr:AAA family ATPase [Thermoleophilia bacterium]
MRIDIVGRARELGLVERSLSETGVVVLTGPIGVGKTRLAEEVLRTHGTDGAVLRIACSSGTSSVPLGAFAHLLPDGTAAADLTNALWAAQQALLRASGGVSPLVVVDDAHHLDPVGAALCHLLARSGRCRLVLTLRAGEAVPEPITEIWKDGLGERIVLGPLEREDARDLAALMLGVSPEPEFEGRLWEVTRGNPLCLREVILAARESGSLVEGSDGASLQGELSIDGRVAELVNARLSTLAPGERSALALVALDGEPPLGIIERVATADAVSALERRGMVEAIADGRRRSLRSTHPLFRDLLAASLTEIERRSHSAALASAYSETPCRRVDDMEQVALHSLAGGVQCAPDTLLNAARRALGRSGPLTAEALAQAAVDAGAGPHGKLVVGEALAAQGRTDEAIATLVMTAEHTDDPEVITRATVTASWLEGFQLGKPEDGLTRLAAARLRAPGRLNQHSIGAQQAMLHFIRGSYAAAMEAAAPILADQDVPPRLELAALSPVVAMSVLAGRISAARELGERVGRAIEGLRLVPLEVVGAGVLMQAWAIMQSGDFDASNQLIARIRGEFTGFAWMIDVAISMHHVWQGRLRQGIDLATVTVHSLERSDPWGQIPWLCAITTEGAVLTGDPKLAQKWRERLDVVGDRAFYARSDVFRARALHDHMRGRRTDAINGIFRAHDLAMDEGKETLAAAALDDLSRLDEPVEAAERLQMLCATADPEWRGLRILATAAQACADRDAALAEEAGERFATWGRLLRAAEMHALAATYHREAGRNADAYQSARRSISYQALCEGASTHILAARPMLLGPRGAEIAELIADGLDTKAITDRLVVSRRTIENHLYRIYRELDIGGQQELGDLVRAGRDLPQNGAPPDE